MRANIGVPNKKTKNDVRVIFHPCCRDAHTGAIGLNFGALGHIADIITQAKFCDNRLRVFGADTPILPFSIGIACQPYNSVYTTVLHCDEQHRWATMSFKWLKL